jgi:hypothetical protein
MLVGYLISNSEALPVSLHCIQMQPFMTHIFHNVLKIRGFIVEYAFKTILGEQNLGHFLV